MTIPTGNTPPNYSGQSAFNNRPAYVQSSQPVFNSQSAQPYVQPQEDPKATTVMVLGIVGIFFGICAIIGWVIGSSAQKQAVAERRPVDPKLKTWTTISKVFSIIYIVLFVLWIITIFAGMAMLSSY